MSKDKLDYNGIKVMMNALANEATSEDISVFDQVMDYIQKIKTLLEDNYDIEVAISHSDSEEYLKTEIRYIPKSEKNDSKNEELKEFITTCEDIIKMAKRIKRSHKKNSF